MFKKNLRKIAQASFFVSLTIGITSCGNNENKENTEAAKDSTATEEVVEAQEVSYNLPSPLQIASIFKKSGLKYIEGITSAQKDAAKYTSNYSKALNLGIYGADLAYCVLNKQNQGALTYMKLSTDLSNGLGMGSVFQEGNFLTRFEKNLNSEDSLRNIIAEVQMSTDAYLEDNEQPQISSIAFAGAWTEAMYIGTKVFEKAKESKLNNKISEQMTILSKIINVLKSHESKDPGIATLLTELGSLQDVYNGFESIKKSKAVPEEEQTGEVITLNDEEFNILIKKIQDIRGKFVTN